ncbi:MAG: hypothetical protein M0009_00805 [Deltaproteobacteria bacterium]|nr:hypothetical protein [Deltaproteobacteria bacterium]
MRKKTLSMAGALVAIVGSFGLAYGLSSMLSSFNATYGTAGTSIASCVLCHPSGGGNNASNLNSYANDYVNSGYSFAAIQNLDSDGDGFTNIAEITARTFPGDAASRPTVADTTAPVVSGFVIPATSTSLSVAITTFTATDNVAVTGYLVTEAGTTPAASAAGWSAAKPASYTFGSAGAKTLYAWAKDGAGNVSAPVSRTVTVTLPDTTAPVVSGFVIPATSTSLTVPITTFTATDNTAVAGYAVTETATAPAASSTVWLTAAPVGYNFTSAGLKTLYGWAKDSAGNVSAPVSRTVTITLADTTAPVVSGFVIPATATSLVVPITTFTATDNTAVTGYLVTETSAIPSATTAPWSAAKPTGYTFGSAGAKTLYAWAKDGAGNISAPVSKTVTITLPDTTAPVVSGFVIPATAASLVVPITTFTATDAVGVTGYLVTESSAIPAVTAAGWSGTKQVSYTFAAAGAKTLYGWAKDAAGNISSPASATVTITLADTTPPVISGFVIPGSSSSLTVPITTLVATDNTAVTGYLVKETATVPSATAAGWSGAAPTSYTFGSAGAKVLYAWAKDGAGNVSATQNAATTITLPDTTAPFVTGFTIPSGYNALTVPISTFTATDDVGVTGYLVTETSATPAANAAGWSATAPTSYAFSAEGTKTLYGWAKDAAGHVSASVSASVAIVLSDTVRPVVTAFDLPASSSSLTVAIASFTATDNAGVTGYLLTETPAVPAASAAGWLPNRPASYTFGSAGAKTLYAWAKDGAGNISAAKSDTVTIALSDRTAPVVTGFVIPSRSNSLTVPVTSFRATDNVGVAGYLLTETSKQPKVNASGWRATPQASYTFKSSGRKVLYAWAKDASGNVSRALWRQVDVRYNGPKPPQNDDDDDDEEEDD